jgi:two-component system, cell cycle sensor histidine kinase and response regulator CckA
MPEQTNFRGAYPGSQRELIMVVDDDALVTVLVERVLTNEGYSVLTASDGPHAIDTYRKYQSKLQLVITDYKMPGMDGFALFNELRLINPKVAVVITSGFIEEEVLKEMLAQGLHGFIPKPLTQLKLLAKVRSMLDSINNPGQMPPSAPDESDTKPRPDRLS